MAAYGDRTLGGIVSHNRYGVAEEPNPKFLAEPWLSSNLTRDFMEAWLDDDIHALPPSSVGSEDVPGARSPAEVKAQAQMDAAIAEGCRTRPLSGRSPLQTQADGSTRGTRGQKELTKKRNSRPQTPSWGRSVELGSVLERAQAAVPSQLPTELPSISALQEATQDWTVQCHAKPSSRPTFTGAHRARDFETFEAIPSPGDANTVLSNLAPGGFPKINPADERRKKMFAQSQKAAYSHGQKQPAYKHGREVAPRTRNVRKEERRFLRNEHSDGACNEIGADETKRVHRHSLAAKTQSSRSAFIHRQAAGDGVFEQKPMRESGFDVWVRRQHSAHKEPVAQKTILRSCTGALSQGSQGGVTKKQQMHRNGEVVENFSQDNQIQDWLLRQGANSSKMPLQVVQFLKTVFDSFDIDGSGILEFEEFEAAVVRLLELTGVPTDNVRSMSEWSHWDAEKNGGIDFDEFLKWYSSNSFKEDLLLTRDQQELRRIARQHDVNPDYVEQIKKVFDTCTNYKEEATREEFGPVLNKALKVPPSCEMSEARINFFWNQVDADCSGTVIFSEFFAWWMLYFSEKSQQPEGTQEELPFEKFYRQVRRIGPDCLDPVPYPVRGDVAESSSGDEDLTDLSASITKSHKRHVEKCTKEMPGTKAGYVRLSEILLASAAKAPRNDAAKRFSSKARGIACENVPHEPSLKRSGSNLSNGSSLFDTSDDEEQRFSTMNDPRLSASCSVFGGARNTGESCSVSGGARNTRNTSRKNTIEYALAEDMLTHIEEHPALTNHADGDLFLGTESKHLWANEHVPNERMASRRLPRGSVGNSPVKLGLNQSSLFSVARGS